MLSPAAGARFRDEVLARGGSRPALESFVAFRGRPPQLDALLRHNGMTMSSHARRQSMARATAAVTLIAGARRRCRSPARALAQDQQVYRYVDPDGRVVYSDRAPPPDAKDVAGQALRRQLHRDRHDADRRRSRRRSAFR